MRALVIAIHEVRAYLKDKGDLSFSLLLPIAIFILMYGAFGGESMFHGTAHVVNEDPGGKYSTILLERLNELDSLDVEVLPAEEANAKLERSDLLMVCEIPEDFSERLASGEPAELTFRQRGNGGQEGQIVASLIGGVVEEMNGEFRVHNQVSSVLSDTNIPEEQIRIRVQQFLQREREHPIVEVTEEAVGGGTDPVNQFLPGIVTMFVLFSLTLSARAIVEERTRGTLERLLTTRLRAGELFFGKFLAYVSRGFIQTFILFILAYIVFQVFTPLSFFESLFVIVFFAAAASGLGLLIASVARSEDSATWIAVFFTMTMVMISGTFFAISEGSILASVSKISINTYANEAVKTIMVQGGSLADVGLELGMLAGVAVVSLSLARILFKVAPGGR
ncbi:MAG: ABC-2 transporter permease [Chloroflexota bacterium]